MKLALIGYGKMGKLIEFHAKEKGHTVDAIFTSGSNDYRALADVDIVIDFSQASCVMKSVELCVEYGKNLIIGTTGWNDQREEIQKRIQNSSIGLMYSPNFSIGVNLFFQLVRQAAALMGEYGEYEAALTEVHHQEKKDTPSGTALHVASFFRDKTLPIFATRLGTSLGKHSLCFDSPCDMITISHEAKSRDGYARGALAAAEWLQGKRGFYTLDDMLFPQKKEKEALVT